MYCGGRGWPNRLRPGGVEMPVNLCAAITAPPIQAGQAQVSTAAMAQNHGQKPRGASSLVPAKNDRPVQQLYLMHS